MIKISFMAVLCTVFMAPVSFALAFLDDDSDTQVVNKGEWHDYTAKEFLKTPAGKMVNAENHSVVPVLPTNYREAIIEKDAPISIIQEQHQRSEKYWRSILQSLNSNGETQLIPNTSTIRSGIDVAHIADLNLNAVKVWNQMVACSNGDANRARVGFLHVDDGEFCANQTQSETVLKSLMELAFNWQSFIFGIEATEDGIETDLVYSSSYKKIFQNTHPLLTEFTLLIWSAYFNTFYERRSKFMQITETALFYFDNKYKPEIKEALKRNSAVSLFQGTALILYFMNDDEYKYSCATYGLWPAFNRILLNPDRILFFSSHGRTEAKLIHERGNLICGEVSGIDWEESEAGRGLFAGVFGIYSTKAYHHKVKMQELYEAYLRSQWDNRNALQKAAESAEPVVEDLGDLFFSLPGPNVLRAIYRLFNPSYF